MTNQSVETWKPELLDNGTRVRLKYTGSVVLMPLVSYKHLDNLIELANKEIEDAPKDNKEEWERNHKGINLREGTGRKGDAEILAMAVSGIRLKDIQNSRFSYNRHGNKRTFGETKILTALSVSKPDDHERIQQLYKDFPDVFEHITEEQVEAWYWKKYHKWNKGGM